MYLRVVMFLLAQLTFSCGDSPTKLPEGTPPTDGLTSDHDDRQPKDTPEAESDDDTIVVVESPDEDSAAPDHAVPVRWLTYNWQCTSAQDLLFEVPAAEPLAASYLDFHDGDVLIQAPGYGPWLEGTTLEIRCTNVAAPERVSIAYAGHGEELAWDIFSVECSDQERLVLPLETHVDIAAASVVGVADDGLLLQPGWGRRIQIESDGTLDVSCGAMDLPLRTELRIAVARTNGEQRLVWTFHDVMCPAMESDQMVEVVAAENVSPRVAAANVTRQADGRWQTQTTPREPVRLTADGELRVPCGGEDGYFAGSLTRVALGYRAQ